MKTAETVGCFLCPWAFFIVPFFYVRHPVPRPVSCPAVCPAAHTTKFARRIVSHAVMWGRGHMRGRRLAQKIPFFRQTFCSFVFWKKCKRRGQGSVSREKHRFFGEKNRGRKRNFGKKKGDASASPSQTDFRGVTVPCRRKCRPFPGLSRAFRPLAGGYTNGGNPPWAGRRSRS